MSYFCTRCKTGTDDVGNTNACYCSTYFKDGKVPPPLYWTNDEFQSFVVVEVTAYNVRAQNEEHAKQIVQGEDFDPNNARMVDDTETLAVMSYEDWKALKRVTGDTRFLW